MHNADLVLFVLTDAIIGNSSREELANHPDKNHIKLKTGTEVGDGVRNDRKKAPLIGGWEHLFLEEGPISSIGDVKASDFADFQNWNRDAKLILYDRAWLPEKFLFNKLFSKMSHLTFTSWPS